MADRLLVNLYADGRVSVVTCLDGESLVQAAPSQLAWPLDSRKLEDLRWYLEDYLAAPFGVYEERGPQLEDQLGDWGAEVFSAVFGADRARDAYERMRARQAAMQIVFRSSSPGLLGLPWELMRDPTKPTPLALELAGMSRSFLSEDSVETVTVPGNRLRVLMVISRPSGTGDVGYRMIARPLLDRLEAVRGEVDLVVLRPPTLDAMREMLMKATKDGEPFHVVHFDGHGALGGHGAGSQVRGSEGVLVFEKPGGGTDKVSANVIARELNRAGPVPLVVLNACQSGAVGKKLEAAVATKLLQEGTASVVAMAYNVYTVAAAEFMAAFYEQLFAGDPVSFAVAAGRRRLFERNQRPSPKGDIRLADWLVPVHYLDHDIRFPQAVAKRAKITSVDEDLDYLRQSSSRDYSRGGELGANGAFIGRDALLYELEAVIREQHVLLLHGPVGIGKTEVAKAFGRWWRDTGGVDRPECVLWHSFQPGDATCSLANVLTKIGQRIGSDFESTDTRWVIDKLMHKRMLLIWDNFEIVRSLPDPCGEPKPLDDSGCKELREFLSRLASNGKSSVLITSVTSEDWLGDVERKPVGRLASNEAAEYAGNLLTPYPTAAPRRARRAFGELMERLDGHPLSMRVVLPHLAATEPEVLLDGLSGTIPLLEGDRCGQRTTSLAAGIRYSYDHLTYHTRRLLPALCLLQGYADIKILTVFSHIHGVPERYSGATFQEWQAALDDAVRVGLITPHGSGRYWVPPGLPAFLATEWAEEEPEGHQDARDAATQALLQAYVIFGWWADNEIMTGDAAEACEAIGLHRWNLGSLLSYALDHRLWQEAQTIAQPFNGFWEIRGLTEESNAWSSRVFQATENDDATPPSLSTSAGSLWLFFAGAQAACQLTAHDLDAAERSYRKLLGILQAEPTSDQQQKYLAETYTRLGIIADERGQLDDGQDFYLKAAPIAEKLNDYRCMADTYHGLGINDQRRGNLESASKWLLKSLRLEEAMGDHFNIEISYHALGLIAQDQMRLGEAGSWYVKALKAEGDLRDEPGCASTCHGLGMVAELQGRLEDAEKWYTRSLVINDKLGNQAGMASTYHELGHVAEMRTDFAEAEGWYMKSIAIHEECADRPGMAHNFEQLCLSAERQGHLYKALEWAIRCVALFDEFPHPETRSTPSNLARLTTQLGIGTLEASWYAITGNSLPQGIREYTGSTRLHK